MSWKGHCKSALFALALASLIAPQAEAIEIFMGANPRDPHQRRPLHAGKGRARRRRTNASPRRGRDASRRRHARRNAQARRRVWWDAQAMAGAVWRRAQAGRSIWRERQSQHQQERQPQRQPGWLRLSGRSWLSGGAVWAGRPGWYRWPAGGAIAAGAAIGFVSAASAAAWAGAPPSSGALLVLHRRQPTPGFSNCCP